MKRVGCLVIFSTLVILVVIAAVRVWRSEGPIEYPRVVLESQPSPDGSWIAFLGEDHFSPGFGGDSLTGVVSLASSEHPDQTIDLLAVDTGSTMKNVHVSCGLTRRHSR